MELLSFFKKINKKGIKLLLKNGKLNVKSNTAIDPELLLEIKTNKEAIIAYLEKYDEKNIAADVLEKYQSQDLNKDLLEKIVPSTEDRPAHIPLSFGQERLWFLDQLQGSVEYHLPVALRLSGSLDLPALSKSLQQVVSRHEVLRTVIYSEEGIGYQKLLPADGWSLSEKDLSHDAGLLNEDIHAFLSTPFDLGADYMFRACLYRLGEKEHVLAGVFHHISSDGWSQGILVREFMGIYQAHVSGNELNLPPLPLQYIDYALWQRNYLEGEVIDKQLSYWEEKLTGLNALRLPLDYARPAVQSVSGATLSFELDNALTADINALSQHEGVTAFMTLLAAYKLLLSRYSGQQDICVGTPIANRTQKEMEGMIGFFVNTLALRTEVKEDASFQALLQAVKQTTLGAYDHQQIPFENVVERVVKTRDMSMTPLFQTLFVLQNIQDAGNIEMDGLTLSTYEEQGQETSKFDLTMTIGEVGGTYVVNVNYCTDLFRQETIERMMAHFQKLLTAAVATPSIQLSDLTTLSNEEQRKLLEDFNDTVVSYPVEKTVIDLIEEQVTKTPEATAIVYEGTTLSFQELNERANQLAGYLTDQGIRPDDLVGICINRSLEMIVGILGILKAGGAYLPIDPDYPQSRIEYMLEDSGVKVVLSAADCSSVFTEKEALDIVLLDSEWDQKITDRPVKRRKRVAGPENLAYVIYTSGSTGKPKGVMNAHKGILNRLLWTQETYELSSDDVVLQKTTFSFDVSVWELLWPLIAGSKLVFARPGGQSDVAYLKELIEAEQVTTLHFVPSMLSVFLAGISKGDGSSIRRVLCSGEALTTEHVRAFRALFPAVRFDNLYGPTEAAIDVSSWSVPEDVSATAIVPIGRPVSNTSLYVLDDQLSLVPLGVVGELCIGGDQLALGYLNKDSLTKEKFVANPFKSGDRLYKTGDLARWLPDGAVEYMGRKDNQVKVRGYRIELGEIENAISLISGVHQSCVMVSSDGQGDQRLVGYVVLEDKLDKNARKDSWKEDLQSGLQLSLPEYMVPRLWVQLDEMPLTANGKLDRKALPSLDASALSSREYVAPRAETEVQLAAIWQNLLGVEKVGVYDDFFELGGHSLLVVRLIAKIQKIGYTLSIRDIFSNPTIASLSPMLTSAAEVYQAPENGILPGCSYITSDMLPLVVLSQEEIETIMDRAPGGGANIQDIYPLSPLQKGMYFHHLMSDPSKGDAYVISTSLAFSSAEKRAQFIEGLKFVINRHDVMRTCIVSEGLPEALQVVLREVEMPVSRLSVNTDEDVLAQLMEEVASDKLWIDTQQAPMMQVKLADDVANQKYYLALNYHHLIMDHIGLEKVKHEILFYLAGKADQLPTPALYRDFIGDTLREEKLVESRDFFSELYETVSEPTYPFNLAHNQMDGSDRVVSQKVMLSPEIGKAVREASSELKMSPAVFFYAAFGLVVGRCSNADYALFGTILLGRLQGARGSDSSLGLFMNTLPVLLDLKGDIRSFIHDTNEHLQKLMAYEQTPLADVQDWSDISNEVPMFSTLLNYRHSSLESSADHTVDLGAEYITGVTRNNLPVNFDVDDYGTDFGLTAKIADIGIAPSAVIAYMEKALSLLVEHIGQESATVDQLSILPEKETHQLLEVFNATGLSLPPKNETIVDLFEEQAAQRPAATAVVYEGATLSYQQLNEHSSQVANYLRGKGVGSDDLVGICINRSLEMMVGILGILKSGGAYVPVDPEFPQTRIDYMLEDSGVKVLLSDHQNSANFSTQEGINVIELDSDWNAITNEPKRNLQKVASSSNLAYVIYTSGSTGNPKGVQITHYCLTDYFHGLLEKTNVQSCDSFGLSSSIATDLGNTVLYASLLTGGALYVLSEDELISAQKITALDIDCLKMVPSHWKTLQTKDDVFVPNKCLILGGEAFTDDVLDLLASNEVSCEVYNHYGPTETTIGKLIHKVSLTKTLEHSVPLGVPFGNNRAYVMDAVGHLCPIGVVGELCIGGEGVAVGYLNRETLTAEKFVTDPFNPEKRIYKTGDLARWLPNGTIEFIGRKDNQIKIRGYRIELGEIENVLSSVVGIINSCVLAKEDDHGDKRLVGYVVMESDLSTADWKEALQSALLQHLPEYMVPMLWVALDEMPLTNNGKIDRRSLPEPDSEGLSTREYVAPTTETELQLAEIWQDLLGVEKVGIYDNFFELGGQSLLAIRLIARIQKLGYTVNIQDFYEDPNIALLSTKLASLDSGYQVPENGIEAGSPYITPSMVTLIDLSQEETETIMDSVPGGATNIQDIYPLSPLQEGIYFHHLISDEDHGDPYVLPRLLSFTTPEQRTDFLDGLRFVIGRHDVLRTCVLSQGFSQAVQVVLRTVDLPVETLSIDHSQEILPQVEKEILPDSLYMDLTTAPTLRAKVADDATNGVYYLVLHNHHLMIDHIGMAKVGEEIMHYLMGHGALLPKPSLYRDFIGDTLNKEKLAESERYFKDLYGGIEVPTYPFNLSDTKVDGGATIASATVLLPDDIRDSIRKISGDLQISPAVIFHAAFGLVVGKCSNTDYAIFGSVLLGRLQGSKGSDSSLGLFMNTLPVLLDLKGDIRTYVHHANDRLQELLNYEQTPGPKIHQWSGVSNEVPLFSALLNYRHSAKGSSEERNDFGARLIAGEQRTNFPFNVDIDDYGDDFKLTANLSATDIDPAAVIAYMKESLKVLLENLVDQTATLAVNEISIVSEEEQHQLLETFNDTAVSYPDDQTIIDLFETQAAKTPEATAVVYDTDALSYQQLNERANQLARYLSSQGIGPDALVGICINRSLEMLVGILGILKAGGAYVPIDPEYPQARIDYMLQDSGVKVVLSAADCAALVSASDELEVVLLDSEWNKKIGKRSVKNLKRVAAPENLAYVIYTSGSTGKPKGVMNAHRGILNRLLWTQETYGLTSEDVVLQKTTFSFDVSVWELLWPLITGSKLVFARPGGQADVAYLKELIAAEQVTTMHFVPSMLGVFLAGISAGDCASLRRVLCSGEALTLEHVQSFRKLFPTVRFDNLYGPTEAAIDVSSWPVPEDVSALSGVPIGRPVSNTQLYIVDDHANLAPIGVVGELCIGGDQVAVGYLNREDLTQERFVADPYQPGGRLYKTGDLARWLPDGTIAYIGRKDSQVKVRGFRIEVGEVENAISSLSEVNQCCVLAKADSHGDKRLIAYVVLKSDLEKSEWKELLQSALQRSLPEYMVPQLWVALEEMPLTSNGKLDRKALPALDGSALSTKEYVAPRTEAEGRLAVIWQELLGVEKVGIYDNFFELGGHSLLVVRMISKMQDIGYTIQIRDIFSHPSIAQLSTKLSSVADAYQVPKNGILDGCNYITPSMLPLIELTQEELDTIMEHVPGGGANIQDVYPLSPLQKGIYFHYLISDRSKGDPYVTSNLLSFPTAAQRSEIIEALEFIVERHDVLRTCVLSDGYTQALQVVMRQVDLPVTELSIDPDQDILSQVEKEAAPESLWIDPSQAPMLQVKVADDVENEAYYLVLKFHHLMIDHVGLAKVWEEISLFAAGKTALLPEPVLYREFIGDTLNKDKLADSKTYFSSIYGNIDEPTYPFNFTDTKVDGSTRILTSQLMLPQTLQGQIRQLSSDLQVSPAVLFHAAFGLVVGKCSNSEYALFGSVFLGRLQGSKGSDTSLGLFMNTLPILLDLKGDVPSYLRHVSSRLQDHLSFEQTPLYDIQNWSGIANEVPLFSALLNFRHSERNTLSDNRTDSGVKLLSDEQRTNYPFNVDVDDYGDDIRITAKLADTGIDPVAVLAYMEEALNLLVTNLEKGTEKEPLAAEIEALSIVPEIEANQLLREFNDTSVSYPSDKTLVDLFAERVSNAPEATAIIFEGEKLTYQQLDERSNQLARYLMAKGSGPDMLVGICIDRSLEMMIGILGILKSGGAYVPIDPKYPQSRIDYMLEDSGVKIVLSSNDCAAVFANTEDLDVVLLDSDRTQEIGQYAADEITSVASPDNLAYVIYTSGSTGNPKGVLNAHKAILNQLLWTQETYGLIPGEDVVLHKTTFSFDVSVWELLWPLVSGIQLVFVRPEGQADVTYLKELIEAEHVTTIHSVPSMLGAFLAGLSAGDCSSLRRVLCSGEPLTLEQVRLFRELFPQIRLDNLYGPTEAAVHVTSWSVPEDVSSLTTIPIGKPVANTSLYVLNTHDGLVPMGAVGELCIGGDQVAVGYLNREDLTNERFVADPYWAGGRLYKTGDLARWLPDGTIDFLGRKDNQVKVRGYRIELGEIENALAQLSGITQCCVMVRKDAVGAGTLVAYVVMEGNLAATDWKETLQEQLQQQLPGYMVPRLWVTLEEMPLTGSGKLDRKALPGPDSSALSTREYVAPRTAIEEQLVAIWQTLLGVEKVGIYDNFFELGGHSLLAVQLISTIRKEMEIEITIKDVFELNCIEQLGNYIQALEMDSDIEDDEILFEQSI